MSGVGFLMSMTAILGAFCFVFAAYLTGLGRYDLAVINLSLGVVNTLSFAMLWFSR